MKAHLLVAVLVGLAGCAGRFPTPPPPPPLDGVALARFDRVEPGVYRSSQFSGPQLRELVARYGIRTVLKLNDGADPDVPGVQVIHRRLNVLHDPGAAEIERVVDVLERAPRPVLVHCTHGEDRTGLIVALYRVRRGASVDAAYADMVRHGFHPYRGVWRAWLRAAGWDGAAPTRRVVAGGTGGAGDGAASPAPPAGAAPG